MQQHILIAVHGCLDQPGIECDQTQALQLPQRVLIDRMARDGHGCPGAQREESTRRDIQRRPIWLQETWPLLVKVSCGNDVDVYVYVCHFVSLSLRASSLRRPGSKLGAGSLFAVWWEWSRWSWHPNLNGLLIHLLYCKLQLYRTILPWMSSMYVLSLLRTGNGLAVPYHGAMALKQRGQISHSLTSLFPCSPLGKCPTK